MLVEIDNKLTSSMAVNNEDESNWLKTGTKISKHEYKVLREKLKKFGYDLCGFKDYDGDIELLFDCLEKTKPILKKYPILTESKENIVLFLTSFINDNDFASVNKHVISLNKKIFRSRNILEKEYKKLVDDGWFVQGTDYKSIIIHEIGHVVSNKYRINSFEIARNITGIQDKKRLYKYIKGNLSGYATCSEKGHEIIAEVFSVYYNSSNPSELSLKFMEELDKIIVKKGAINNDVSK